MMIGDVINRYTKQKDDQQYKKILWVAKNIKPVKVIIIKDKKSGHVETINLN
jgi:hypothetical protein